jgi:hypothetical protein
MIIKVAQLILECSAFLRCIVGIRAMHKGIALQRIQNTRLERQRKVVWLISLYNH